MRVCVCRAKVDVCSMQEIIHVRALRPSVNNWYKDGIQAGCQGVLSNVLKDDLGSLVKYRGRVAGFAGQCRPVGQSM